MNTSTAYVCVGCGEPWVPGHTCRGLILRQTIACEQFQSAQAELMLAHHDHEPDRLWQAQDRNWFWSLQVQASRI